MVAFWLLSVLLGLSVDAGSAVVFLLAAHSIYVGGDSRTIGMQGEPHPDRCKIVVSDNRIIFGNAGALTDGLRRPFIDMAGVVLKRESDVAKAAGAFDRQIVPAITQLSQQIVDGNPGYFARKVENHAIYQAAFAKLTPSGPQIAMRLYVPIVSPVDDRVQICVIKHNCLAECGDVHLSLGHFDHIDRYLREHPAYLGSMNPVQTIHFLIGLETEASPNEVGGAIAIFRQDLEDMRGRWIEPGVCK
jgi:hypothetical protein